MFEFQNSKSFQKFIDILSLDNKENQWLTEIKEIFYLMAYSSLTRYAILSILLSLYSLLNQIN